jgi:threonine dehydrogenase-like Zn-dependent dehydrogenase
MRALVIDGPISFVHDYPEPASVPHESIVKVRLAGVCGTDLELARGYMGFRGVPGHEFVGEVVKSPTATLVGKRVVGEINCGCGLCGNCIAGMDCHCANRTVLGIVGRDGAFADYLSLPDRNLYPVPDAVPDDLAIFTEPVAAAYEIFEQFRIPRNHRIAILGDGRLGATVAMMLRAEDYEVVVGGHHPEKLDRLVEFGLSAVPEHTLEPGFDVVIDCTGAAPGFARAMALVRPRGTLILKSTAASGASLNLAPLVINEVTVIGSRCGRFAPALAALEAGKVDPRPLISAVFALKDGIRALAEAENPLNFKILLKVS